MELVDLPKANGAATEDEDKMKAAYQDYLQKSCEVGQIDFQLEQLITQKSELEKQLDVTKRKRNKAAQDHRDLQKHNISKLKGAQKEEGQH